MIRVEHLCHDFGTFRVLHDVSFVVPRGEIVGFIGPNGAGKTTTLRMIATLLEPEEGRVLVDGLDVTEKPREVRRILGFMPDSFGVYERITVREYLEFFAAAMGIASHARARTVEAVMELTVLGELRDRLVAQMSKGMKQRLAIARTLLHDPKVLVLDEPANGLDPRARIEMRELILELRRLGKTILLSSHILTELSDMATYVAILEKGRLLASGVPEELGRRLRPERALHLRFANADAGTAALLSTIPGVIGCEPDERGGFLVRHSGDEAMIAEVVARCVGAGLAVVRVEPESNDLERIFLEVTRGALQ